MQYEENRLQPISLIDPLTTPRPRYASDQPAHDNYGRRIDYLRISLTDRCNLRCVYCITQQRRINSGHPHHRGGWLPQNPLNGR